MIKSKHSLKVLDIIEKLYKNEKFDNFEVRVKYSVIIQKIKNYYKYSNRTLALFFQIDPKKITNIEFRLATICVKTSDNKKYQTDYDLLNVYVDYLKLKRQLSNEKNNKKINKI